MSRPILKVNHVFLPRIHTKSASYSWTVLVYAIVEVSYTYTFGHNPDLRLVNQCYPQTDKLHQDGGEENAAEEPQDNKKGDHDSYKPIPKLQRPSKRLWEGITYITPLLTLDLTMIKKFGGVPVAEMAASGNYDPTIVSGIHANFLAPTLHNFTWTSPLQTRRALPPMAPSSRELVLQLITSIFIYDTVFFFFHLALHKLPLLKKVHLFHHNHEEINPQITNQLDIIERLGLVLLANFSLNIIKSHVVTRTLFVPMFVWLLVDIHSGMDLPYGYDKLLPPGWAAGSRRHSVHHKYGQMYYEPFFCWWDDLHEYMTRSRRSNVSREVGT